MFKGTLVVAVLFLTNHAFAVTPPNLAFEHDGSIGQSFFETSKMGGYNCFSGVEIEDKSINKTIFHVESVYDAKTRLHTTAVNAFHIIYGRYLTGITLASRYANLEGMTIQERKERCGDQVIDGEFAGQHFEYAFTYQLGQNQPVPATFDVVLGNSPQELNQLMNAYGPIFTNAKKNHVNDYYLGESPWRDLHMPPELNQNAIAFAIAYMSAMQNVPDSPHNRNFLPIVRFVASPKY